MQKRCDMFAGTQEILVLVVIVLAIFFVPRLLSKRVQNSPVPTLPPISRSLSLLSGRMRLAITASLVWPLLTAGYFEPWKKDMVLFLYIGIGPVFCGWSLRWILAGFRRKR